MRQPLILRRLPPALRERTQPRFARRNSQASRIHNCQDRPVLGIEVGLLGVRRVPREPLTFGRSGKHTRRASWPNSVSAETCLQEASQFDERGHRGSLSDSSIPICLDGGPGRGIRRKRLAPVSNWLPIAATRRIYQVDIAASIPIERASIWNELPAESYLREAIIASSGNEPFLLDRLAVVPISEDLSGVDCRRVVR